MNDFYPDNNIILEKAHIERIRSLPPDTRGEILVSEDVAVSPDDVVAQALTSSDYKIVDVAKALGLESDDPNLADLLKSLKPGTQIKAGDTVGRTENKRLLRKLPRVPSNALVSLVEDGRVILEVGLRYIQVEARLSGTVRAVDEEHGGVLIETYGSLIQCAWGNGPFVASRFSFEPGTEGSADSTATGLRDLLSLDISLSPFSGKVIILLRPIIPQDLPIIQAHDLKGLVAPSAPPNLRETLMKVKVPIILTEGFGNVPPTSKIYDILSERRTAQAIFDATLPDYRTNARPEIIIPGGVSPSEATEPQTNIPLSLGMLVRVNRAPYFGRTGTIVALPNTPLKLDNGLRVQAVQVKLNPDHQDVVVPVTNLQNLGVTT